MMKVKYYKCPTCNKKFKTLTGWGNHVESLHPETIPEGFSLSRYFYFTKTGKTHGTCRTCKGDTLWNEHSMKYDQYCTNPECKKEYVKIAKQRMIGKYGKVHLLNNPEMQKKMLSNRKISGKYKFEDGTAFEYVGSYEREFLVMLDTLMEWHSNDLISPSPHTYYYNYKNKADEEKNQGVKFYIPDFYIPSLNLEIEIKQQTSTNQKFNEINRVKERLKDEVMETNKNVNYLKINDNDFTPFFEFLLKVKQYIPSKEELNKDIVDVVMESNTEEIHETIVEESKSNMDTSLFHLSMNNLDGKVIKPSIPNNFMTKHGYEESKTKRVCFSSSIDHCLRAFSQNCTGMKLYVHVPDGEYDTYNPSLSEVPDVNITSEVWITEPVRMKCIGQIEVLGDRGDDGLPYKYGNKTAELYDWDWKWIKKSNSIAIESVNNTRNNNCIIVSCFAGVGKKYAINHFRKMGLIVNDIEKTDSINNLFGSSENFVKHIIQMSKQSDILFIPYFLDMEKNYLKGKIDYWLVFPSNNNKREYMRRYKELDFTFDEVTNLSTNWTEMINDCKNCKIPDNKKIELSDNEYVTDVLTKLLNNSYDVANEAAVYTEENRYPVYIILMHYGTVLANIIKKFTKDEFSHACLSFNSKLDPMYSFGNKKVEGIEPGFVVQNPDDPFYKKHQAYYNVFVMYVNKETYYKMQQKLKFFIKNKDTLKYDLFNLINVWAGRPSENSKKYFCSRFVMSILSAGKEYEKVPSLYRPQELSEFDDISLVNKGYDFSKYNYKITQYNTERIRQGTYDEFAYESSIGNLDENLIENVNEMTESVCESSTSDVNPRVIKNYGVYDSKNIYNACVLIDTFNKPLRGRSEILIVKGDKVFLSFKSDSTYKVPGGSWNENENHMMAAIREAKEEVRINTKNVVYSGLRVECCDKPCKWVKQNIDEDKWWYGYYSEIYVGEFDSNYKGKINEEDKDDMVYSGRFYPIKAVYNKLTKEHKLALDEYIVANNISVKNCTINEMTQEGLISFVKDLVISVSNKFNSWKSELQMTDDKKGLLGNSLFTGVRIREGMIEVRGINYTTLRNRITKYYTDKSIYNIFLPKYNILSYRKFERKQISRAQIKIDYLYTPEFFALELVILFKELGKRFRDKTYLGMTAAIYKYSWLAKADINTQQIPYLDLSPAKKLSLELKEYQKEFIMNYPKLKAHLNLNGYVLAFEQGLGKTITATALAECLKVDHVYIVCPNSLKENWAIEIRKYYKQYEEDPSLWRSEVFICNQKQILFDKNTTKFIITNIESIDKMFPYIMGGRNLLVIDESHNFRNLESKRTNQLLELRDKLHCTDVLAMSGTPIKAAPSEIAPILAMIDPTFTDEAAVCFAKAFKLHETFGTSLVQTRFGKIMYRKEKDVLEGQLPEKFIDNFPVTIANRDKYVLENVRNDVFERFGEIYASEKNDAFKLREPFFEMTKKYSRRNEDFARFKRLIELITTKEYWPHEIDKMFCENYMKTILERITSSDERKQYQMMINTYVRFKMHCLGVAQGEILPKYRRDMFIDMYEENKYTFFDMIKNNTKKTLIFTQFKDVANYIQNDLNRNDIGSVIITGDVKNRLDVLTNFKENDAIQVLVATSQTIGTGVTLTEATQMFFFGPPWRDADFAQCSDRIHRIGQTDDVYIYTVVLDTGSQMNLSTRMESILSWSKRMTESVIITTDNDDIDVATVKNVLTASESSITFECFKVPEGINTPEQLSNWMKSNIKYNHTGKYKSADEVLETLSGDCHDQSEFESKVFSKLKIPHGKIFMMEYNKWPRGGTTHTCVYFKRKNKLYWFENAWNDEAGVHGPYLSLKALKDDIQSLWKYSNGYDKLIFSSVKNVKPGMNLNEYVVNCLSNYNLDGPDPLGNKLVNEVYTKLPNKELYDEMMCKDTEDKLKVYKEIPVSYLSKLITYESGFHYMKAIANYDIPKNVLIEKRSIESPLGTNGKFKDLKFTKLGSSVFSEIDKGNATVRFEYNNDNGFEYWNIISNRDIKKGTVLSYNPNDESGFADPSRM